LASVNQATSPTLSRLAAQATTHCMIGVAWVAAFPVNRWLIARGRGHAVVHAHHGGPGRAHGARDTHERHHG
jgi:hypothetical protein